MNLGLTQGFKYQFWYLLADWISQVTSLGLIFFIYKMALIIHGFYWCSPCAVTALFHTFSLYNHIKWNSHYCFLYLADEITEAERLGHVRSLIKTIYVMCHITYYIADSPEMVADIFLSTLSHPSPLLFRYV